jgi:hypothetical protein
MLLLKEEVFSRLAYKKLTMLITNNLYQSYNSNFIKSWFIIKYIFRLTKTFDLKKSNIFSVSPKVTFDSTDDNNQFQTPNVYFKIATEYQKITDEKMKN